MIRTTEITKLLEQAKPVLARLNDLLKQERISYELIRGDLESAELKKNKLLDENNMIRKDNDEKIKEANGIVENANTKAAEILKSSRDLNVQSLKLLDSVKVFCKAMDRKHSKELGDKARDLNDKIKDMEDKVVA